METEFLHDYANFSSFGSQGSGLNLSGTFFEKVIDNELAFRDDIPQEDYWFSPLNEFGSSSLSPNALSLRGDSCDFSLKDLNPMFDTADFQHGDLNNLDLWNSGSDDLTGYPDFLSTKNETGENFCDNDENLLAPANFLDKSFKSEFFRGEDETPVDVETVDAISDASKYENDCQSFQPCTPSPSRPSQTAKPVKPNSGSLLEAHLRSPIQTIINAAHRPSSINSCTRLNNCKIIQESRPESSSKTKSNGRKQKIRIAQVIPNKKSEGSSNRMIDAGRTLCRNKLIKLVATGASGETILLDHDYCSNNSRNSFVSSVYESNELIKVPSTKCELESVCGSANKAPMVKPSSSASKQRGTLKDYALTKTGTSLRIEANENSSSDAQSITLSKTSKIKSCDNETAFRKDNSSENIVQNSVSKNCSKGSIRVGDVPPCDKKIAQNIDVTVKQKVPHKKPVMVSLLNKSTVYKDAQKLVSPCDGAVNEKKSSNVNALVSIDAQAGVGRSKLCNDESRVNTGSPKSSLSGAKPKELNEKPKDSTFKNSTKPANNKRVISAQLKDQLTHTLESEKVVNKSLSSSKANVQPEKSSKCNPYVSLKKGKTKKKVDGTTRSQSTSQVKDSTKSAKTVNTNFKDNFKSDLNLPMRNSNVISSDTKEAYLGSQSNLRSKTVMSNDCKTKEDAQIASHDPVRRQEHECAIESDAKVAPKKETNFVPVLTSFQRIDEPSNQIIHNRKVSDSLVVNVKSTENHCKNVSDSTVVSKGKDRKNSLKTPPAENRKRNDLSENATNLDLLKSSKKLMGDNQNGTVLADESDKVFTSKLKTSKDENDLDASQDEEISGNEHKQVTSSKTLVAENSVTITTAAISNSQVKGIATANSVSSEKRSPGATADRKKESARMGNSSSSGMKKEESGNREKSSSHVKRKLNLSEYRDRQRKRLDPGVSFSAKWIVPLIELDSSVTDRSSYKDLINSTNDSEPKILEPVPSNEEIEVAEKEPKKLKKDLENTKKDEEVSESAKKVDKDVGSTLKDNKDVESAEKVGQTVDSTEKVHKDVESTKKDNEVAESAKKMELKESVVSTKEKSTKRSSSRNGSDCSSNSSKRSRSSRSSSSSNRSPRRHRRRTPMSYRPCSRSSSSSNSSSSSCESRSRSHSRSRSYRTKSYRYSKDTYRQKSRVSDRKSRDYYYYYGDHGDRRRSRSRENRRRSRENRQRSREDRRRSRDNNQRSKSYRRGRSSSSNRKTSSISPIRSEVYRSYPKVYNISAQDKAIEEGRMIYVGKIRRNICRSDLRSRFKEFGPIEDVALHFRDKGVNCGFVTFKYSCDARSAIKYGNDDKSLPQYDICYGGRRQVCSDNYSELNELYGLGNLGYSSYDSVIDISTSSRKVEEEESFDTLLQDFRRVVSERTQKEI